MTDLAFDVVELVAVPAPPEPAGPLAEMGYGVNAWTPPELDMLVTMFRADAPMQEIAAAVGREFHGVRAKVCALGLRRNSTRPWSDEEDAWLVEHYRARPVSQLAVELGRSPAAVYARASLLRLTGAAAPDWTEWEDAQLVEGYRAGVPVAQLAVLIGRPLLGTTSRATVLGLRHAASAALWDPDEERRALELAHTGVRYSEIIETLVDEGWPRRSKAGFGNHLRYVLGYGRGWGRPWTPEEDDLLRQAYREGMSIRGELTTQLGRTVHSVRWRADELGLRGSHPRRDGFRLGAVWQPGEDAILRRWYGKETSERIAARLPGRNRGAVLQRAHVLGLEANYHRDWTPAEDRAIAIAYAGTVSLTDLAEALGRDAAVVSKRAIRLGMNFKDRPHKAPRGPRAARPRLTLSGILLEGAP